MGTRADFYIGRGKNAEWIGSVAWDGYEWDDPNSAIVCAETEEEFRLAVEKIAGEREDFTRPEQGWPWPWDDSGTTDYAYYFANGSGHVDVCPESENYPDMSDRKNITLGPRSGIIII